MPTELEEVCSSSPSTVCMLTWSQLVGFITNQNPQVRLLATENLVPYSLSDPSIFKVDDMRPIQNLKVLLNDHPVCAFFLALRTAAVAYTSHSKLQSMH